MATLLIVSTALPMTASPPSALSSSTFACSGPWARIRVRASSVYGSTQGTFRTVALCTASFTKGWTRTIYGHPRSITPRGFKVNDTIGRTDRAGRTDRTAPRRTAPRRTDETTGSSDSAAGGTR